MKWYTVAYGYREDDGLNYGHPTRAANIKVSAESEQAARLTAIDGAYAKNPHISHVTPYHVQLRDPELFCEDCGEDTCECPIDVVFSLLERGGS